MRISTRARRALAAVATSALIVTGGLFASPAAMAAIAPPPVVKLAALGDSLSLATMSCSSFSNCLANSWSTGTSTTINSHALRLRTELGVGTVTTFNNAVNGAKVAALDAQAVKAVGQGANYVTIEVGSTDACTPSVSTMTSPEAFRAGIQKALATLAASPAAPQIFVASIPSLQRLYDVNKASTSARLTWGLLRLCQSMLANPTSTRTADVQRRLAVQQRVDQFNAILAAECAVYPATCRYDGGAVATEVFLKSDISTRDYFHPSASGQAKLAAITWARTQWKS